MRITLTLIVLVLVTSPCLGKRVGLKKRVKQLEERADVVDTSVEEVVEAGRVMDGKVGDISGKVDNLELKVVDLEQKIGDCCTRTGETGDWKLIFRATAGNGDNAYDAWTTGAKTTDVKPSSMTPGESRHYRNTPSISEWSNVQLVKYSLFKDGREVAFIIFNGIGSTNMDWFAKNRVLDSSWSAVTSRRESYNYFSIAGHASLPRRFFVNLNYGGCPADKGYAVVVDTESTKACQFDTHDSYPQFLYSILNGPTVWNASPVTYGKADYMAVFFTQN